MLTRIRSAKSAECYMPSTALANLMRNMLQLSNKLNKEKRAGGGKGSAKIKANITSKELVRERKNHNRRKVYVLNNHIFPAMANLTVLLEHMQKNSYIREIFEDDIKGLFLGESTKIENKAPIFQRFLVASVCKKQVGEPNSAAEESPNTSKPSFRFILCMLMQWVVYQMIQEEGPHKYGLDNFLKDVLYDDMKRPLAWTQVFAQRASKDFDEKRRPALF
jgi:hypothetical protein